MFSAETPMNDIILVELHQFKKYLKFKFAKAAYDGAHASAIVEFKAARHSIVVEALRNFDNQEKEIQDFSIWSWSPLCYILKFWHVRI